MHAADDGLRDRLVPLNKRYPIEELLDACRDYARKTGRRVSYEYALFAGVNDSPAQAQTLSHRLAGTHTHVNLIPANPACRENFKPSPWGRVLAFERELKARGISCTVRVSRGQDIEAGCGQLRARSTG
jgi:23S rRNA (adenine2503-C2)-methyltransferase